MKHILSFLLLALQFEAHAQAARLDGRVVDARTGAPLAGAHVRVWAAGNSDWTRTATTGDRGEFAFSGIPARSYDLEVTYVGYLRLTRSVSVVAPLVSLHDLPLQLAIIPMMEITISGNPPPAVQKADTTEFFAGAFKSNPDATAEDLMRKLPGITVDNGTVKAEGEDVQMVLVDGKPFFGSDPTLAIRNLPADAIERIQVFDKMSDQAEFTGFDDGQSTKTINIITRPERRNALFGRMYAGYGEARHYAGGAAMHSFENDQRISLLGIANNVNQQNFSAQDILGVLASGNQRGGGFGGGGGPGGGQGLGMRGTGGGAGSRLLGAVRPGGSGSDPGTFLVGQQSGVNTAKSIGLNYQDSWKSGFQVSGSYFFNLTDNTNTQTLNRQYFSTGDAGTSYRERNSTEGTNTNHRLNVRMEYPLDSLNSLLFTPQFSVQGNRATSGLLGANSSTDGTASTQTDNGTTSSGTSFSGHLLFRHKFDLPGRTMSLDIGTGINPRKKASDLASFVHYATLAPIPDQSVDQQGQNTVKGSALSARLVYTEPLSVASLIQINYAPSVSRNASETKTFAPDRPGGVYSLLDTALSDSYDNTYITQTAGIGYLYRTPGLNMMAGLSYQAASLSGDITFPSGQAIRRTFESLLPAANLNFTPRAGMNLRIFFRTSTQVPAITQLQPVIDNTNPLYLTGGNPGLKQSTTYSLTSRFSMTDPQKGRSRFLLLSVAYTKDYLGNALSTLAQDTVLSGGVRATRGTQLTVPVNLNGYWNARGFFTMGIPAELISSNVNLNTSVTYTRTPGHTDGSLNLANTYVLSQGVVVGSNISPEVDFQLSYTGSYTIARNTLQSELNSNYYSHTAGGMFNWIFWSGWVLRNDLTYVRTAGQAAGYDQNSVLWTASFSRKFFEDQRGEVKLAVSDILRQNQSTNRTITESYVEDTVNQVLPRYALLTFTYTMR